MRYKKLFVLTVILVLNSALLINGQDIDGEGMGNIDSMLTLVGLDPDAPLNTLTQSEADLGWELLFDGSVTSMEVNWRRHDQDYIPDGYRVDDNAMCRWSSSGDLDSRELFLNFVWAVDWKVAECGNSGIFIRGDEHYDGSSFYTAIEHQVLDNYCGGDRSNWTTRAGAIYGIVGQTNGGTLDDPTWDATNKNPDGSNAGWNRSIIVANDSYLDMWMNGIRTIHYDLESDEFHQLRCESSAWNQPCKSTNPEWGDKDRSGTLVFQDHGDRVWYRNIKIKVLPDDDGAEFCDYYPNDPICSGCTDSTAANYNSLVIKDDGSCSYTGCANTAASNYFCIAKPDAFPCVGSNGYTTANIIDDNSCLTGVNLHDLKGPYVSVAFGLINVELPGEHSISVIDVKGFESGGKGEGKAEYDISNVLPGIYIVTVKVGTAIFERKTLIR